MILRPIIPKKILKQPYYKGIITGTLVGLGLGWTVLNILNHQYPDLIISFMVFALGIVQYILETNKDYNFID